jgi:hypothetical protein
LGQLNFYDFALHNVGLKRLEHGYVRRPLLSQNAYLAERGAGHHSAAHLQMSLRIACSFEFRGQLRDAAFGNRPQPN